MTAPGNRLVIHIDGASRGNPGPAAIGVLIQDHQGSLRLEISHYIGEATNNQAEYRALITALQEAAKLGATHVDIRTDSKLVAEQIRGNYRVRHPGLKPLFQRACRLLSSCQAYTISDIPREENTVADALANRALDTRRSVHLPPGK
ncbi:MAG: ribonuclease HI family protein [Chloroflexi bacterium]|nr:ribonuclease HI family protein [Chloroflexota bacterium]